MVQIQNRYTHRCNAVHIKLLKKTVILFDINVRQFLRFVFIPYTQINDVKSPICTIVIREPQKLARIVRSVTGIAHIMTFFNAFCIRISSQFISMKSTNVARCHWYSFFNIVRWSRSSIVILRKICLKTVSHFRFVCDFGSCEKLIKQE